MGITVYGFLISKKGWIKQMDFFDLLTMIGGLSLFLFGMNLMGQALERRAGNSLKLVLGKLTTGCRYSDRCCGNGGYPELFRHNGHGGRLRKFRTHDLKAGN